METAFLYQPAAASGTPSNPLQGVASPTGNGVTTTFSFPHGLGRIPVWVDVQATNMAGSGLAFWTADATNITITYVLAPSGSLGLKWRAY